MKLLATILTFFMGACVAFAQFDGKPIRAIGVVSVEVFPGRPNYGSIKEGDVREEAWILTTSKRERFHLVVVTDSKPKFAMLRRCLGKSVRVDGTVWEAHTGHHRTPFLITVRSIVEQPNKAPEPPTRPVTC
jgi:hypothetical protein